MQPPSLACASSRSRLLGPLLLLLCVALTGCDPTWKRDAIELVRDWSYVGVFLFLIACGLGFPSPEEVALIGGGWAVYKAHGDGAAAVPYVLLMVTVAMTGVIVGDLMLYGIGWRVGDHSERLPIIGRHLTKARMARARQMFAVHGAKAVFFGRFLFGVRAVTFFVSGSMHVPITTFILMDGLAALLSVPISIILAWYFGSKIEDAVEAIGKLDRALLIGLAIAAAVGFLLWRRRQAKADAEAERLGSGPTPVEAVAPGGDPLHPAPADPAGP